MTYVLRDWKHIRCVMASATACRADKLVMSSHNFWYNELLFLQRKMTNDPAFLGARNLREIAIFNEIS